MLVIRETQIQAFSDKMEQDFEERLRRHVELTFPEKARRMGPEGVRGTIRAQAQAARRHGLTTERQIATWVNLEFMEGPGFERRPWARQVLGNKRLEAEARIRRLEVQARYHHRRAAR
jgi:hypothetical protein